MGQQPGASTQHCNPTVDQHRTKAMGRDQRSIYPSHVGCFVWRLIRRRPHDEMRRSMKGTTNCPRSESDQARNMGAKHWHHQRSPWADQRWTYMSDSCRPFLPERNTNIHIDARMGSIERADTDRLAKSAPTSSTLSPELQELASRQHLPYCLPSLGPTRSIMCILSTKSVLKSHAFVSWMQQTPTFSERRIRDNIGKPSCVILQPELAYIESRHVQHAKGSRVRC